MLGIRERLKSSWFEGERKELEIWNFAHQHKAPAYKSIVTLVAIHDCGFELLHHLTYSLYWASLDLHLFSGYHFASDEVIKAGTDFLEDQNLTLFISFLNRNSDTL